MTRETTMAPVTGLLLDDDAASHVQTLWAATYLDEAVNWRLNPTADAGEACGGVYAG